MPAETLAREQREHSQYIDFWNNVLVPKFIRWKHILVDGLTLHSEAIFPSLRVNRGDKVVDAGCGFGDTAIKLARLVGPSGSVLAVDCRSPRGAGTSAIKWPRSPASLKAC